MNFFTMMQTTHSSFFLLHPALVATVIALIAWLPPSSSAQVPQIINYQGKISVGASPFTGNGQFKFALVNGDGTTSYWSHDGSSTAGSPPISSVSLPVVNGLYVVPLGDTAVPDMQAVPASVFTNSDVRIRVWFDDGTNGSQQLTPDQRITSVGYAMVAGSVPDGSIGSAQLAPNLTVSGNITAAGFTGNGSQLTGLNSGGVFVRWGCTAAPDGTTLLYQGVAFGGNASAVMGTATGAGGPFVLAANDPAATNSLSSNVSYLFPVRTVGSTLPPGITGDRIVKAAVCYCSNPVTTIWGTWSPPEGWSVLYKGYAMGAYYGQAPYISTICVEADSFDSSLATGASGGPYSGILNPTEIFVGSAGAALGGYTDDRFVKAAVIMKNPAAVP